MGLKGLTVAAKGCRPPQGLEKKPSNFSEIILGNTVNISYNKVLSPEANFTLTTWDPSVSGKVFYKPQSETKINKIKQFVFYLFLYSAKGYNIWLLLFCVYLVCSFKSNIPLKYVNNKFQHFKNYKFLFNRKFHILHN